jgi:hypothetical protein
MALPGPHSPTPQDWLDLYEQEKRLLAWPVQEDWIQNDSDNALLVRNKMHLPLADKDSISIEGMSLTLDFDALAPHDGGAILRLDRQRSWHLGRFDFGANETHSNSRAIAALGNVLPPLVRGSHVHPISINARLG